MVRSEGWKDGELMQGWGGGGGQPGGLKGRISQGFECQSEFLMLEAARCL